MDHIAWRTHLLCTDGLYSDGPCEDLLEGPQLLDRRGIPHLLKVGRDVLVWLGHDAQVSELVVGDRRSLHQGRGQVSDGEKGGDMNGRVK